MKRLMIALLVASTLTACASLESKNTTDSAQANARAQRMHNIR